MESQRPRMTAVIGLARALIETVGPREAAEILIAEFGWDLTFQSLALLPDGPGRAALGITWAQLLVDSLRDDLGVRRV